MEAGDWLVMGLAGLGAAGAVAVAEASLMRAVAGAHLGITVATALVQQGVVVAVEAFL